MPHSSDCSDGTSVCVFAIAPWLEDQQTVRNTAVQNRLEHNEFWPASQGSIKTHWRKSEDSDELLRLSLSRLSIYPAKLDILFDTAVMTQLSGHIVNNSASEQFVWNDCFK